MTVPLKDMDLASAIPTARGYPRKGKEGPGRAFPAGPAAPAGRDTVRRLSVAGPWPIWTKWTKPGFLPKFRGFSCSGGCWTEVDNLDKTLPRLASPGLSCQSDKSAGQTIGDRDDRERITRIGQPTLLWGRGPEAFVLLMWIPPTIGLA